ncbi:NAD(P)-binding protein [Guyanagaster necrorhizus]|uniref:NAD(P)-binding protein n=1 Tax=Guyanagaster necrorhizus TaxID=856835 RepID=A0A9P7VH73_9AGAR|nr:NAD(P)-binding protein [Guyanagaster necrorhizus MCA 3950]KAG7440971.1 NAD(P)-binding protein [Guyanagaster necrorhizus MCA 3950]
MGDHSERKTVGGRVAIVGTGSRAAMFVRGIAERPASAVVAILEPNSIRAAYYNDPLKSLGSPTIPVYKPEQFKVMLKEERVDTIVVICIDALHQLYIIPALEAGVRVLTEKPMTTDADKCRAILETVQRTDRHLTVAFNYRHRQKGNSGGLMVHKSGHHFDLVNWWIDSEPETVVGMGKTAFYARGNDEARKDHFAMHMEMDNTAQKLYAEAESEDGYHRDMKVFGPDIAIEDDMSVMVRYESGAALTYYLTTYSPWEGYRVMFNGSEGRLELDVVGFT